VQETWERRYRLSPYYGDRGEGLADCMQNAEWVRFVNLRWNASVFQAFTLPDQLVGCAFQIPGRMTGLVLRETLRTKVTFALVVEVALIVEDA